MNKFFSFILFLVSLIIAFVHAEDIKVEVGGPAGENLFYPQTVIAMTGDTVRIEIIYFILCFIVCI
jgi:hypothetical protein